MIKKTILFFVSVFDYFHKKKIISFLKNLKIDNLSMIFDVGAHKGESITFFLSNFRVKKIISFEASPINFNILKKNTKKFNIKFNNTEIIIENIGIGSNSKKVIFHQLPESSSSTINKLNIDSSYYKKKSKILNFFRNQNPSIPIEIKIDNLYNYMNSKNILFVDILKIDTEGYEYEILLGLKEKLSSMKIIIFEHHYDNMINKNYKFGDIRKLLTDNNFKQMFKAKMPFRKTFEYIFINKGI
tara:strand:- start:2947 stop:3675 length:729 start_codon:yes stop_codon:yes gene_type:complete